MPCSFVNMEQAAKKSVTKSQSHFLTTSGAELGSFLLLLLPARLAGRKKLVVAVLPSPFHLIDVKIAAVRKERIGWGNEVAAVELLLLAWLLLLLHLLPESDRMLVDWLCLISRSRRSWARPERALA